MLKFRILQRCISSSSKSLNVLTMRELKIKLVSLATAPSYYGGAATLPEYTVTNQSELPQKRMSDSYCEAVVPLKTDGRLRLTYTTIANTVRFGRLLEDLDKFAVWLTVLHTRDPNDSNWKLPFAIVTAQVDRIDVAQASVSADEDIFLSGCVTWAGSSSMETTVQLHQEQQLIMEAKLVMVARQLTRPKSAIVNGLLLETDEDRQRFQKGEDARQQRKLEAEASLLKVIPRGEEVADIHQMFLATVDPKSASFQSRIKPAGSVWMEETTLKSVLMNHPQESNVYNKIFGGYLMRVSFELAWMNALTFSCQMPRILAVDDIHFRCPVPIGSLLFLSSQVGYTKDKRMQVKVHAEVVDPRKGTRDTTNIFHFTFGVREEVPAVIPKSYAEAMMYIDARRHFGHV